MDQDYSALYLNVVSLLSSEARRALNVVSQHTGASSRRVQRDNVFWKRRFEVLVGQEYPAARSPGTTTWQHKVEMFEKNGDKSLLLSTEILDVEAAIHVMDASSLIPHHKCEIVGRALLGSDTRIITQLASVPELEFGRYAAKAVEEGIELIETQSNTTFFCDVPPAVLQLILHPMFCLHVDVPRAITNNIPHTDIATLAVLINDQRALLTQNCEDYLAAALENDRNDVFIMILGYPEVAAFLR